MDTTMQLGFSSVKAPEDAAQLMMVPPQLIERTWPIVEHFFEGAPAWWTARYDKESVRTLFLEGHMQLWCANDEDHILGVLVTELRNYPLMKICNIVLLVGTDMPRWMHHLETVELWARREKAEFIHAVGRPGLKRVLKPWGYEQEAVALVKNLETMTVN